MTNRKIIRFTKKWNLPIVGGCLFSLIFFYWYARLDPDYYTLRDDGVITLSHAKNLVDYGFIGVGPSGERVEGYSAPVQFFIYALTYLITGADFSTFAKSQTLFCTFALGFLFALYFNEKIYFSVIATAATAISLTQLTSFIQWHGSGMENAITHTLFALTVYILFKFARDRHIDLKLAIVPFLASISRIEGIYHIFPLLLIFSAYWVTFEKSAKGILFFAASTLLWVAYNVWRFYYFGDLTPNTAYAQDISISNRIDTIVSMPQWFLNSSTDLSKAIFSAHGGYFILAALPFTVFVSWKKSYGLLFTLSLSLLTTAWLNPFVFGPTRLDITRSTTQMAFFVFVAIFCIFYSVKSHKSLLLTPLLIPAGFLIHRLNYVTPYDMCCTITYFDQFRHEFTKIANDENLPRPTISNPDLGVISWHKQFNIVDLGGLGSQVIAKIKKGPILANYFFDYAAPDIIESHEYWSCLYYDTIFSDPRFSERYIPVRQREGRWESCGDTVLPVGIWIRKDVQKKSMSPERRLIDDLAKGLNIEILSIELAHCQSRESELDACTYVARTAYRFLPELRLSGKFDQLLTVFESSRTRDFDDFLLTGFRDGKANEKAISFIQSVFYYPHRISMP